MPPISPAKVTETFPLPRSAFAVNGQGQAEDEDMGEEDDLFGRSDDEEKDETLDADRERPEQDDEDREEPEVPPQGDLPPPEGREPMVLNDPVKPSAEDVEKHNATHMPYRSWCDICVRAVGREDPHRRRRRKRSGEETGVPKISMDYQELISLPKKSPEEDDIVVKIIVVKDESSGTVMAHRVNQKGHGDEWTIKKIVQDISDMGRTSIVLKTDGEPAMISLQKAIQNVRKSQTIPENPPAYNPQSNGACEKAVQDVDGQLRKLKLALEARTGMEIKEDSNIVQWMIPHAAFIISKFSVGHDGMTPHERLTGRKWARPIVEFGEVVLAKLSANKTGHGKKRQQRRKLAPRSIRGIFVGQIARTGEQLVIKQNGDAVRCRTIRRVPAEDRWDPEMILNVLGVPRLPAPSQADPEQVKATLADDEDAARSSRWPRSRRQEVADRRAAASAESGAGIQQPESRASRDVDIRRLRINESLLSKYGYTDQCAGCQHKLADRPGHRPHTQACRERLYEAMQGDEQDRDKLAAEDVKMKLKEEMTGSAQTMKNEPNVTAYVEKADEVMLETSIDRGKLEVIPEGRMRMVTPTPWILTMP